MSRTPTKSPQGLGKIIYLKWEWQTILSGCWKLPPKSMRDHQRGVSRTAPSQTCRQKPCSVQPSARFCRGRELGAPSSLFTSQESQSGSQIMGVVLDWTHPGVLSWSSTVFTLLFFQPDFLQNQNLFNHICPSPLPCIPFSSCELTY